MTFENAAELTAEARARAEEWERIYGRPNYAENLTLALQLAGLVEQLLVERNNKLHPLLRDMTDPDDCSFDHHGGCQTHGYLSLEPGELCPHEEARQWLAQFQDGDHV